MKLLSEILKEICGVIDAPFDSKKEHSIEKGISILNGHKRIAVSVSGGSDSDIMVDLIELLRSYLWGNPEIFYVFFDTGLEYEATKSHLDYLEWRYGVTIDRRKPRKSIPAVCREFGIPFISKDVSDKINRLQKYGFAWTDSPDEATPEKYGNCKSALDWFFCRRERDGGGNHFDISRHKYLHEFLKYNPPNFVISEKCCDYAKKYPASDYNKERNIDLTITGMRLAEGGRRAGSVKECFTFGKDATNHFRPLWWWSDVDKANYKKWREMRYSDCYEVYGLKRTGCVGCPFSSKAEQELKKVERFEPKLVSAARCIFADSYEYKRRYLDFKAKDGRLI